VTLFWILIGATVLVAVGDWWAVSAGRKPVEYALKPLTMAVLIAAALAMPDPVTPASRTWFVAALALSLVGDVFLMLPDSELNFIGGLGSFLLGHVAYILGILAIDDLSTGRLVVGIVLVLVGIATLGQTIVRGAYRTDKVFGVPVALYIGVISTMVALAIGTRIGGIVSALLWLTLPFAIPAHMYFQLKGAYGLGTFSALWRTWFLLWFCTFALLLFTMAVTLLSA
jgi:uncharacterized membrane protein YhhN